MTTTTTAEQAAITRDAALRLAELRAVRDELIDDRDDPEVLSELVGVESQIRAAEQAINGSADR